jgi:hypothetical protein
MLSVKFSLRRKNSNNSRDRRRLVLYLTSARTAASAGRALANDAPEAAKHVSLEADRLQRAIPKRSES